MLGGVGVEQGGKGKEEGNPFLRNFQPRLYQETIFHTASKCNALVVLPTGMGKTAISMMLAAQRLHLFPSSKILILAPTKPLVQQHMETFQQFLNVPQEKFALFTGEVSPEKRRALWKESQIIFSTPQGLENDIISSRINLEEASLLVFDEAHKAVGDYAYVFLAKEYARRGKFPKILGLTASPGSEVEKIMEVCRNLRIEEVEVRTDEDPDVKPYIQEVEMEWVKVQLPESFQQIQKFLKDCYAEKLRAMQKHGYLNRFSLSKTELLELQGRLHGEIAQGNKDFNVLRSISLAAEALKVVHALELLETQGIAALWKYLQKLQEDAAKTTSKAVKNLMRDIHFKSAIVKVNALYEKKIEHPKMEALQKLLAEQIKPGMKVIIFTQFRDSAVEIEKRINSLPGIKARIFVGQAKKGNTGLSQKKQKEMLDEFREGSFNVLIATSVAEEGLDIPKVDMVIFYEPIPSAIRHIQRRGRTGRLEKGKVIILVTEKTRDVGFQWSAYHKEKRMLKTLRELKKKLILEQVKEKPLDQYFYKDLDIKIFADHREKSSPILKELMELGVKLSLESMQAGDFLLSSRCVVEHKTVPDFVDSIIDGRLLEQIKAMKEQFERPVIVLEGTQDIYSQRKMHPNAIRGMLATIAVSYGIPIIQTKTARDTAELLAIIARREQEETTRDFSLHGSRKPLTLKEQQEYVISSLPGIGPSLAKPLLEYFGSVKETLNAPEEKLKEVEGIGEKKAKEMKRVVEGEYERG